MYFGYDKRFWCYVYLLMYYRRFFTLTQRPAAYKAFIEGYFNCFINLFGRKGARSCFLCLFCPPIFRFLPPDSFVSFVLGFTMSDEGGFEKLRESLYPSITPHLFSPERQA
jgi:hypothetical protein